VEDELHRLLAETPELAGVLGALLDRRERTGRLPTRLTVDASPACAAALRRLLSARAVRDAGPGRVRLDLAGAAGLEPLLYRVLARAPRDPAAEERALRAALDACFAAAPATTPPARAWLAARRTDPGELLELARTAGIDAVAHELAVITRCVDAALALDAPLRLANFAARVLGSAKALAPGSERLRRIGEALYLFDPGTRADVDAESDPASLAQAAFRALEARGVRRDEAALAVLCFGPLVYEKAGVRFDHVARHAVLGDPCLLTLAQLRGATIAELPVARVTVIENRTPFLDYVDALTARPELPRELVVCSDGQAGWAVVTLLRLVARARAGILARHAGDLDRAGVLILRSLARRSGLRLTPHLMDPATLARFAARGQPLRAAERARLEALVAADPAGAPAHDLLAEILARGVWLEQEAFAAEALLPVSEHDRSASTPV
jgi:hypothetical protein